MMASFFQMNTASTSGTRSLPSNTVANPKGEFKAITTRSGLVLDGPTVPMPPPFINPKEDERAEETLTDPEPVIRDIYTPKRNCKSCLLFRLDSSHSPLTFVSLLIMRSTDSSCPLILGRPFLRTARALIDVHGEEMILRDGNKRLILNMRNDTSSYSNEPHQESINMIDVYNVSHEDYREDLFAANHPSGNPTSPFSSHTDLISPEVNDDIFDSGEDIIKNLLNLDKTKDHPLYHDNQSSGNPTPISKPRDQVFFFSPNFISSKNTTSSSPSLPISEISGPTNFLEVFAMDELALITFPPGIDEMDSILKDSVDENSLDDNLDDTISEMFIDEHALDYSSLPLWDEYDDNLLDHETVNDDTYDDPFDSKEEKIKDSKILIDELDLPGSSDFLPFPECDSVFYEDFSEVDALPSTNNEDKVFNPGILIHENLFEVTNCATPEKNVKKTTNASLILKDFNPPLYELPFHKEVQGCPGFLKPLVLAVFVLRSQELQILSFILGIRYPNLIN
ncbi:hypothetical protein Tco_0317070 [Tanacetum coccineum]